MPYSVHSAFNVATGETVETIVPWTKELLLQRIAEIRYEKQAAGTTVFGLPIPTDATTQIALAGNLVTAPLAAAAGMGTMEQWKTAAGFVQITIPQAEAMSLAIRSHVSQCFARESDLVSLVDIAETDADLEEIANNHMLTGWPV